MILVMEKSWNFFSKYCGHPVYGYGIFYCLPRIIFRIYLCDFAVCGKKIKYR